MKVEMSQDPKETAPISLIIKMMASISIGLMLIIILGFVFAFEEARDFLLPILVEVLFTIGFAILFPFLLKFFEPLIISYFSRRESQKVNKMLGVLPKKKAMKKKRSNSIREAIAVAEKRRKQ